MISFKIHFLFTHTILLILSTFLLACSPNKVKYLNPQHTAYCTDYALKSKSQFKTANIFQCGLHGLQWNEDVVGQKRWCEAVQRSTSSEETVQRSISLLSCFGKKKLSISMNDLELNVKQLRVKLAQSIKQDNLQKFLQLLAAGANLEGKFANQTKQNMTKSTPSLADIDSYLPHIFFSKAYKIASFMLDHGANPNTKYTYNMTLATGFAMTKSEADYKMLELLLSKGMNPDIRVSEDHPYPSLLALAASYENTRAVEIFLKHGASPKTEEVIMGNSPTSQPLSFAVTFGRANMVKVLLAHHAPPNLLDKGEDNCRQLKAHQLKYTPLDIAKERLQKLLNKKYPDKTNDVTFLSKTKDPLVTNELRIIEMLKSAGAISMLSCK